MTDSLKIALNHITNCTGSYYIIVLTLEKFDKIDIHVSMSVSIEAVQTRFLRHRADCNAKKHYHGKGH